MLIPSYFYTDDFEELHSYFLSQPHTCQHFHRGDYLWRPNECIERIYYIESGIARTTVQHEDGHEKLIHFHGKGTVCPGCHESKYKIEQSIIMTAVSDMETLVFSREKFYHMYRENRRLNALILEGYARFINLLIYEAAHQEYNSSLMKLCNLLYLFTENSPYDDPFHIELTQTDIANNLTINRVNVAKHLSRLRNEGIIRSHRNCVEIVDIDGLKRHCSFETMRSDGS